MSAATVADARLLGEMWQQLGGVFIINAEGKRVRQIRFVPVHGTLCGLNGEDWERVVRMVNGMIAALPWDLRLWLFDAFAEVHTDPENITATASEPTRRAA